MLKLIKQKKSQRHFLLFENKIYTRAMKLFFFLKNVLFLYRDALKRHNIAMGNILLHKIYRQKKKIIWLNKYKVLHPNFKSTW